MIDSKVRTLSASGVHGRLDGWVIFGIGFGTVVEPLGSLAKVNACGSLVNNETTNTLIVHLTDCRMAHRLGGDGTGVLIVLVCFSSCTDVGGGDANGFLSNVDGFGTAVVRVPCSVRYFAVFRIRCVVVFVPDWHESNQELTNLREQQGASNQKHLSHQPATAYKKGFIETF